MEKPPGLWARLKLRWRIRRRDPALMQMIARAALVRSGVCDESDSILRFAWDRDTGHLIIMVYLAHFDHAAWTMSRHIEGYLIRQFKGLYDIPVHSVHLDVIRARAFKELPPIKSASSLRAVLRERRASGVKSTGVTGRKIADSRPFPESGDAFEDTARAELDDGAPAPTASGTANPSRGHASRGRPDGKVRSYAELEEYLSVPGYEVSEVNFEEFLNSLPAESALPPGVKDSRSPEPAAPAAGARPPAPAADAVFLAEADLMKRDRQ